MSNFVSTLFFNSMNTDHGLSAVPEEPSISEFLDCPVLIDDVDTTIMSFIKAYGQPPHVDIEEGEDSDLDEFDDVQDDQQLSLEPDSQPVGETEQDADPVVEDEGSDVQE